MDAAGRAVGSTFEHLDRLLRRQVVLHSRYLLADQIALREDKRRDAYLVLQVKLISGTYVQDRYWAIYVRDGRARVFNLGLTTSEACRE